MAKKSVTMSLRVKVVPCEGFELRRITHGEYLVANIENPQLNTVIDADALASIVIDAANGELPDPDGFNGGFNRYWRIEEVVETG